MASEYSVTGRSIVSKLDFVRVAHGRTVARSLTADLELPELDPDLWYPFDLYDRLLRAIAERCYSGELARLYDVGAFSAEHALTTTFKKVADSGDMVGMLERFGVVHQQSYNAGRAAVLADPEGRRITVHLAGAPTYSEADLWVAAGFYAGAAQLLGCHTAECRFCLTEDGGHLELKW